MRADFPVPASADPTVIDRSQAVIALLAAGGLLALTISAAVRATSQTQLSEAMTIIVAWVAVLASALLGRQRSGGAPPPPPPFDGTESPAAALAAAMRRPAPHDPPPAPAPAPAPNPAVTTPAPAQAAAGAPRPDEPWFEALLEFAQQALGALQGDRLRVLIAEELPRLVGRADVWVVANLGGHQQVMLPAGRAESDHPMPMLTEDPRQWATFPLKADGQVIGVLGVEVTTRGITAREWRMLTAIANVLARALKTSETFEAMREATLVDPLTGCATRTEGMRRFEAELRRAERSRTSLGVLMIDLDHFKSINDRYGHNTGDAVLSAVGETLLGTLRASDIRCRWGGEEFLVVLPESTIDRARSAAEALRQRIANTTVRDGAHTVHVTTSVGITVTRPGETDIPRLLGRADAALYQAKSEGRNRIVIAFEDKGGTPTPPAAAPADRPPAAERPPAGPPAPSRELRNPAQGDRRTSFGRRRTDLVAGPWAGTS